MRGMIRNVLKIVSFGSMDGVDDPFISVRDLYLKEAYTSEITRRRKDGSFEATAHGGWLRWNQTNECYEITPCDVARVEQADSKYPMDGLEGYAGLSAMSLGSPGQKDPPDIKYQRWDKAKAGVRTITFDLDGPHRNHKHSQPLFYAKAINLGCGSLTGTLVLTGQPSARGGNHAKHMEFIFHSPCQPIPVADLVWQKFEDTHAESAVWTACRGQVERAPGVPVFWLESENEDESGIHAFGLAQMFRLPARQVRDGLPPRHHARTIDLCDRIFGGLDSEAEMRGRVFFSDFVCTSQNAECEAITKCVLGSPKPSFYPAYLEQNAYTLQNGPHFPAVLTAHHPKRPKDNFISWLSPEIRLRGWKRYLTPTDNDKDDKPPSVLPDSEAESRIPRKDDGSINWNTATAFRPLKAGTCFTGTMRFHNLRAEELGALLWVLTWGGEHANLRHRIGMAKSLGVGSCVAALGTASFEWQGDTSKKPDEPISPSWLIYQFTEMMDRELPGWQSSPSITELKACSTPHPDLFAKHAGYPKLEEFRSIKKDGIVLPRASELASNQVGTDRSTRSGQPPRKGRKHKEEETPANTTSVERKNPRVEVPTEGPTCLDDLIIGEEYEGQVMGYSNNRDLAFIGFGFKGARQDGALHISQISRRRVGDIARELPLGKWVWVKVVSKLPGQNVRTQVRLTMIDVRQK
jgi:CRISPR-associated protein (TIGR03986 family)